jgi:hypothetical protein
LVAISTTIAVFGPVPVWVIEHDCVMPVVLMHFALFAASSDFVSWTTTQRLTEQRKLFLPRSLATWTTRCDRVHVQPFPGQRGPA